MFCLFYYLMTSLENLKILLQYTDCNINYNTETKVPMDINLSRAIMLKYVTKALNSSFMQKQSIHLLCHDLQKLSA